MKKQIKTVIFDVDRTLANITNSYENSIRGVTAEILRLMGARNINEQRLAKEKDLYPLWQRPELADVWYLTYAVVAYYQMQLLVNDSKRTKKIASLPDIPSGSLEYRIEQEFNVELNNVKTVNFPLYIKYSFSNFVPFLLQAEGTDKITVIRNALQLYLLEQKQNPKFIQNALDKIWAPNLLKALFQQMFMDETAYRKEYGAPFVKCRADWNNDTTTIPQKDLQKLLRDLQKKGYALGIATARPKSELNKFLTTFTLLDFFNPQAVVPLEGGSKAERIATALEALSEGVKPQKIDSVYVGDTIGDIQAVKKLQKDGYTIRSIAVGTDSKSKNLKQKNRDLLIDNADSYIETLDSLTSILSSERR